MHRVREQLFALLSQAVHAATAQGALPPIGELPAFTVEPPPQEEFGDFATNLAMVLARPMRRPPQAIATAVLKFLPPNDLIVRAEVAPQGFINFRLTDAWLHDAVQTALEQDERYGTFDLGRGRKVQVEFVSANPTGPLQIGNARGGALGDAIANLLTALGYQVEREYYINDVTMSLQVQRFGESLEARYLQLLGYEVAFPEEGYKGEYVSELARELVSEFGDAFVALPPEERRQKFFALAKERIVAQHKAVLERFGIRYDNFVSEQWLYDSGRVARTIELLNEKGLTYEAEGALWMRTTAFGDQKDEVLVRRTGAPTYFASDIAYHLYKHERGYAFVVDVWGADHHGHVARMHAALKALGLERGEEEWLKIVLYQLVRLVKGGETVRLSKRAGEIVSLDDLLDWIGKDAARFFLLLRSADTHLDIDLDLAVKQSQENPVYYVQYAHARCCSIFKQAQERTHPALTRYRDADLRLLADDAERRLMKTVAAFPDIVYEAATKFLPHLVTQFTLQVADRFHDFYERCRVLGDDAALSAARLALVKATQIVLRNALSLLGITAPEAM
ncbi:Arginine--tRNA ligase [bacterium HR17]|uniref:Arginine--tRNA ligase n=1 Tax=Candidatus Fervidibacter japonicus TaxID=2035412 RepID=A0A2H5XFG4_9BACT|nr:Arginine--tRNA ligase [bacterium HR17]